MSGSDYLRHLPEIFRTPFVEDFLKGFEALISGREDALVDGEHVLSLEERLALYSDHLDPALVPLDDREAEILSSDFLTYLASWVALDLDRNWDIAKQRVWLSRIVPLYKRRGTLEGIRAYLNVFVGRQATVEELPGGFVIGESSTVGENTFIAGAPSYFFRVRIAYAFGAAPFSIDEWRSIRAGTRAIVDLEKPAHTYYRTEERTPGIVVAERSTVGTDTLIWERSQPFT